jgi:hypothetical protein
LERREKPVLMRMQAENGATNQLGRTGLCDAYSAISILNGERERALL